MGASPISPPISAACREGFHQWVEYCNAPSTPSPEGGVNALAAQRARNGDPEPFNVRHWGVGDEMWGCGGSQTPEEYGELYRRFTEWLPHFDGPASALRLIACGANGDDVPWVSCTIRVIGAPHALYGFSAHYYTSGDAKIFVAGDALTFGATIFCFVTMSETSIPVRPITSRCRNAVLWYRPAAAASET